VLYRELADSVRMSTMKIINSKTTPEDKLKLIAALRRNPRSKEDLAALDLCEQTVHREIEADVIRMRALGVRW
jgi:hypothetical protein